MRASSRLLRILASRLPGPERLLNNNQSGNAVLGKPASQFGYRKEKFGSKKP